MATLLATDGIASLQRDFGIAVAAEVVDCWTFDRTGGEVVVVPRGDVDGDLIGFAGHGCGFWFCLGEQEGKWLELVDRLL